MRSLYSRVLTAIGCLVVVLLIMSLAGCGAPQPATNVVPQGEVAFKVNPAYAPGNEQEKYSEIKTAGEQFDPATFSKEPYIRIAAHQLGIMIDDPETVLFPGEYPRIPTRDVRLVDALYVPLHHIGLYIDRDTGNLMVVGTGYHPVINVEGVVVPVGQIRYRTLPSELVNDANACASYLCETTITEVILQDSPIRASFDADIIFSFNTEPQEEMKDQLYALGDIRTAVQNLIGTPLRSRGRTLGGEFTLDRIQTVEGRLELETKLFEHLVAATQGKPVTIHSVSLRDVKVGDQAWRDEQVRLEQQAEAERKKAELIAIQRANLTDQQELEAQRNEFTRVEAAKDTAAQVERIRAIREAFNGADWQTIWVLTQDGQLPPNLNATPQPAP